MTWECVYNKVLGGRAEMKLEVTLKELSLLINGVVEELNQIEVPIGIAKELLKDADLIRKGGIAIAIELLESYIDRHQLLIKLWQLDNDVLAAQEAIEVCRESIREARYMMSQIKNLTEVSCERKAERN